MFGLQGTGRSRWLQPLWVCASTPSHHPSLVLASPPPIAPTLFSCPVRVSAVSRQHWHEGRWRGGPVLVSGGPGISAEAMADKEAARERQKEQFTEKHAHSLSLETFLKLKGCEWRHLNGGTPLPPACLRMPRSLATPEGGSLVLQRETMLWF